MSRLSSSSCSPRYHFATEATRSSSRGAVRAIHTPLDTMLAVMDRSSLSFDSVLRSSRRVLADIAALPRWSRVLMAVLVLAAWALAFPRGGAAALVVVVLCAVLVAVVAWRIADPADRRWVLLFALLA